MKAQSPAVSPFIGTNRKTSLYLSYICLYELSNTIYEDEGQRSNASTTTIASAVTNVDAATAPAKAVENEKSFSGPTDASIRQKAARDKEEEGLDEEAKAALRKSKKKKFKQEEHYDDCGSDVSPIEEKDKEIMLALDTSSLASTTCSCFFDDICFGDDSDSENEMTTVLEESFSLAYLYGSDCEPEDYLFSSRVKELHINELSNNFSFS